MKDGYYKNPDFLRMPDEKYWAEGYSERWSQEYKSSIKPILRELELLDDEAALALAKNMWYSKNAKTSYIREQLIFYKFNKD